MNNDLPTGMENTMKIVYGCVVAALLSIPLPAVALDCLPGQAFNPACQGGSVVTNTNTQHQGQSQKQGQTQSQDQNQNNSQQIAPQQSVKFEDVRQSPAVLAPALTSAGQNVCLGSFSLGVSVYGAGASFGKTVVDAGCERRNNAALLHQFGRPDAALRLMMLNDEVREALNPTVKAVRSVEAAPAIVSASVEGEVLCKATEQKVRAGNGEWFCRAQP